MSQMNNDDIRKMLREKMNRLESGVSLHGLQWIMFILLDNLYIFNGFVSEQMDNSLFKYEI